MGVLGMLVVLWRLWKFTLLPALHPREPKELPYWIPGVSIRVSIGRVIHTYHQLHYLGSYVVLGSFQYRTMYRPLTRNI